MLTKIQRSQAGFTLIEIMIVVAIIAMLAAIAVPSALRARKRAQASSTLETLRDFDAAQDQWAIENGKKPGDTITNGSDLAPYCKKGSALYNQLNSNQAVLDAVGGTIVYQPVDSPMQLSDATYGILSDVLNSDYWGPYYSGS